MSKSYANHRLCCEVEFHFDARKSMVMSVDVSINKETVPLSLGPLMQFLYKNEETLHHHDSDFGYLLSKLIKKHELNNQFLFGISKDYDIALLFDFCRKKEIEMYWKKNGRLIPISFHDAFPVTLHLETSGRHISATLVDHNQWLSQSEQWLLMDVDKKTLCFSHGVVRIIPAPFLSFMDQFYEKASVIIKHEAIPSFIHTIYNPYQKLVNWIVDVDFSTYLPQDIDPIPVLELTYQHNTLQPVLSFQYGTELIRPEMQEAVVLEKSSGRNFQRNSALEAIFQDDLITLFTEQNIPFLLNNPGDIATFMDKILPVLNDREWIIRSNVPEFNVIKDPIKLEFKCSSSGKDWFHFEPNCQVLGQNISLQEIASLMVENQGYLKTKQGFVKIEATSQDELRLLAQSGAFSTGKVFSKKDILPLMYSTRTQGVDSHSTELVQQLNQSKRGDSIHLPETFKGTLRDYQEFGVSWMNTLRTLQCGGILADDMGLGKTVQTLALSTLLDPKKPVLIIGPTNVIYNWESEINKFVPGKTIVLYNGQNRENKLVELPKANYVITSFGVMKNDIEWLSSIEFSAMFVDEAQYIKNPNTQVSQAIRQLNSEFKLAMTGTPIENHLNDLWSLFDFIMPGYLGSQREFDTNTSLDISHLKTRIKPFLLRREKKEVLTSLPDKTEMIIRCQLAPEQLALYQTILEATKRGIKNSSGQQQKMHILTSLLKLRQVCTHPGLLKELSSSVPSAKTEVLKDKLIECIEEGHKVVLFSQFTGMLDILQEWATKEGLYHERIDGTITGKRRQEAVERFQTSKQAGVFLISLKAGGVGINLTSAEYVIHVDPWWNPAIESQATDRVYRMGQTNKVFVYKLIAEGTIEDKIYELQEEKKNLLSSLVDVEGALEKNINLNEVSSLLMSL